MTEPRVIRFRRTIADEDVERLQAAWKAAYEQLKDRPMMRLELRPPLPRKVRARLWLHHRINRLGIWLADHDHADAAVNLWRICRMW